MAAKVTHGHTRRVNGKTVKSLTYHSWKSANDRCNLPGHKWWDRYGGRGIKVCDAWRTGTPGAFAAFLAYLDTSGMGVRPNKYMTLDRFPNLDGDYEPGNVRWADKATQRANQVCMQQPTPAEAAEAYGDPLS